MPPLLLAFEPGSHAAHSQGPQILALDVDPEAETANTPRHGAMLRHTESRQARVHPKRTLNLNQIGLGWHCKEIIAECTRRTTMREIELEFKLWQ